MKPHPHRISHTLPNRLRFSAFGLRYLRAAAAGQRDVTRLASLILRTFFRDDAAEHGRVASPARATMEIQ
ncbi:hypothetical protein ZOD2009_18060 [Haladaptatus paucihalophilus DX253]|uniref:Uncharacterized protein n=1 Tax=Haladaptatus paucihalophilus DX253 TaxID=797209 RepID=E7QXS3_HALPU|nr:hypothetical protein [Haladaptatus paucihalophilus]EFW90624.1 hypothetical protein ZOD2009_18060 [Haladaptatus paucihalophilus DX253]SHL56946.1 hypothetical protein SAMN05444342_4147 [Haladaptatus paucihalophilus DX253]